MKKLLFLILFSIANFSQGIKITALAESPTVSSTDLFVIVTDITGTATTKKVTAENLADSMKVWIKDYIVVSDPFTRRMNDETDRIYIPKFEAPYFGWQTDYNSGMNSVDKAVKYFDPIYFQLVGDDLDSLTATGAWNLIDTNNITMLNSIINVDTVVSSSGSIYREFLTHMDSSQVMDSMSAFSAYYNTLNYLTNVAYKAQDNDFSASQTIDAGVITYLNLNGYMSSDLIFKNNNVFAGRVGAGFDAVYINDEIGDYITLDNYNGKIDYNVQTGQAHHFKVDGTDAATIDEDGISTDGVLAIANGTAPSSSPADVIQLYAEDESASSELKVRDEAGNITILSPHPPAFLESLENDAEGMAWAYNSVNPYVGKEISVDMFGAIQSIEEITGKQFIFIKDIPESKVEDWYANQDSIEAQKDREIAQYNNRLIAYQDSLSKGAEIAEFTEIKPKKYIKKDPPAYIEPYLKIKKPKKDEK
jgi:hypothetical protein